MASDPQLISATTVSSLAAVLALVLVAGTLSVRLLPAAAPKVRFLFAWHAFDAAVHFCLEGSYLYHCFFSWAAVPVPAAVSLSFTPPDTYFLGRPDRLHGAFYSDSATARLWQEYARADRRWGGTDLTVISLELLTVFVMAPLSVWACWLLVKGEHGRAWFAMAVVATGELYGGFMTFAPEWLTGNPNLDASNWMFLWLYLVFFNAGLWVVIPLWVLREAYSAVVAAFAAQELAARGAKGRLERKSK